MNILVGAFVLLNNSKSNTPCKPLSLLYRRMCFNVLAHNWDDHAKNFRFFAQLKVCVLFSTLCWILLLLFPKLFAGLFTNSVELIDYAALTMRIYMAGICALGFQLCCQQSFMALGQAKISLFTACLRKIILLIPLIYILPCFFENKVLAVFMAEPVSDIIAATVTTAAFMLSFDNILKKGANSHAGVR